MKFSSRSRDCVVRSGTGGIVLSSTKKTSLVAQIKIVYSNRVILPTTGNSSFNRWFFFEIKAIPTSLTKAHMKWREICYSPSLFFVFLPFHFDNDWIERQSVKSFDIVCRLSWGFCGVPSTPEAMTFTCKCRKIFAWHLTVVPIVDSISGRPQPLIFLIRR